MKGTHGRLACRVDARRLARVTRLLAGGAPQWRHHSLTSRLPHVLHVATCRLITMLAPVGRACREAQVVRLGA